MRSYGVSDATTAPPDPLAGRERGGRRSPSAGCSSAGRAASPSPARRSAARRRSAGPPSGRRPRSRASSSRWAASCSSSSRRAPRAAPGTASPGPGEVVEWDAVLKRAGVVAAPHRVAHAYLELAVLVRALQGLADSARLESAPGPRLALGRPLRPAREPARRRPRRPARACRLIVPSRQCSLSLRRDHAAPEPTLAVTKASSALASVECRLCLVVTECLQELCNRPAV